jgi:acetyl esterase/lipase
MFDESTREIPWVAPSTGRLDPDAQAMAELSALFDATPLAQIGVQRLRALMPGRPCGPVHERRDALIDLPGRQLPVRIYRPSADDGLPVLVFFHGGGWVIGTLDAYDQMCSEIALAGGCIVVSVDYRLAPEHPFPAALEDALRAYQWVLGSGTDPAQLTLAGDSAGAGLVLSLVLTLKQQGLPLPGGTLMLCPGFRLSFEHDMEMPNGQPGLSVEQLRGFAESYLGGHPADDPILDPLGADLTGLPPMLIQGGTGDVIVEDAHRLAEHARRHGVDARLELYPVDTHDFQIFWSFLPEAAEAVQQAGHFASATREAAGKRHTASPAR